MCSAVADADVVDRLKALHPERRDQETFSFPFGSVSLPPVDGDEVRKAFPVHFGASLLGLRPNDVKRGFAADTVLRLLAEVVVLMLHGGVLQAARPYICGASLIALKKHNSSLRPTSIGDTIRCIVAKVLDRPRLHDRCGYFLVTGPVSLLSSFHRAILLRP